MASSDNTPAARATQNTVYLSFPSREQVLAAYRQAPTGAQAFVICRADQLAQTLASMEQVGFVGMSAMSEDLRDHPVFISAAKGKDGPCYDTGRTAAYSGGALAALDDDNHLIVGQMRICEKTARIYAQPIYAAVVDVSPADPDLAARLEDDPVPFDCDTFQADSERLAVALEDPNSTSHENTQITAIYPGPFRMLILRDGSILRRGQPVRLATQVFEALRTTDRCEKIPEQLAPDATDPDTYHDLCAASGPACLLGDMPLGQSLVRGEAVRLEALADSPSGLQRKLGAIIRREEPYLLLTGTDPADADGCCPNTTVAAANALVAAGILETWAPPEAPGTCPTGIYAFRDEIDLSEDQPQFHIETDFRETVLSHLQSLL